MKFILTQISAAVLAATAASAAYLTPRQEATPDGGDQQQNNTAVQQYPQGFDAGVLNGTWYLTGVTQNIWSVYELLSQKMDLNVNCLQFNVSGTSNTTLDIFASTFLSKNSTDAGVNATAAGAFILQSPDSQTNVSNHEFLWDAYASQVFVNKAQWENFTSNGQSTTNASETGSTVIPGTKPIQASVYTQLIDSNAQPGSNDSTNYDTVFIWGSQAKTFNDSSAKKRAEDVYGIILSKTSNVEEDAFNKTVALLPPSIAANNVSLVKLNDTCTLQNNTNSQQNNGEGQQNQQQ
ncbi:hypothetical protein INT46_011548 [Mucor plumbeus]|uniref:Uncharacterized protein n=1 Tax=Mucor plumbeus TaxID=97098 RepID=A0A8H7RHF2_9FUNG|nr:hypothetical protein INT46_011548 [Mucor plumbeus]